MAELSPMMQNYLETKSKYQDAIPVDFSDAES